MKSLKITRRLLDRARSIDPSKPVLTSQEQLDDVAYFYKYIAGLKIDGTVPAGPIKRAPQGWVNMEPDSMSLHIINEQRKPLPDGKWGRLILAPRGATKSVVRRAERLRVIPSDREMTTSYNCQNIGMAYRTVTWVAGRLTRRENIKRFGEFRNPKDWSKEQFTIIRNSGIGDNPTMIAGGPDKDVTGGHPLCFDLDDIVVPKNNRSKLMRRNVITWFEELQLQRTAGATMEAIGTWWPGHNLWTEIIDRYSDEWEVILIGVYGPAKDSKGKIVWDYPEDKLCFPWLPESYWGPIRDRNPAAFQAQFMNQRTTDEDAPFEASFLHEGDPPMLGDRLHPRLAIYMLTDLAQTDKATKGTSRTALITIAKDVDGMIYVVDIDIGRYNPVDVEKHFLTMYGKWLPHVLRYATMETRGPGKDHINLIPQHALIRTKLDKKNAEYLNFIPKIIPVPRSNEEDKASRINMLYQPFSQGKIAFSVRFVPRHMFRIDSRGMPMGLAAEEYLNYSPFGDCDNDFMDALSDAMTIVKNSPLCPDPVARAPRPKDETDYEWSLRRASKGIAKVRIVQ